MSVRYFPMFVWAMVVWTFCLVALAVYNYFFHPLAKISGPRAASVTTWWKTYIEVIKQESMVHLLMKLHKKYGDIVRVGPNEVCFILVQALDLEESKYAAQLIWRADIEFNSFISPIQKHITRSTTLPIAGTKSHHFTNLFPKITLPSA